MVPVLACNTALLTDLNENTDEVKVHCAEMSQLCPMTVKVAAPLII